MQHRELRHLDRDWEAAIPETPGADRAVRFRGTDPRDGRTYEARVAAEELEAEDDDRRELALRRGLESALVLEALTGHEAGLTAEEIANATGMPAEAAADRLEVLDSVQPVLDVNGPRRYRTLEAGD